MTKLGRRPFATPAQNPEPLEKPDLPPHPEGREWSGYARRYWDEVWGSDARLYWYRSDLILLERCLLMVQQISEGVATTATLSELRRTEEALFLSPGSRQRSYINTSTPTLTEDDELARRREERRRIALGEE